MIKINQLSHYYQAKQVLNVPTWQVENGEQWLLRGKSGSGKTTLLHIIGGLLRATQGEVWVGQYNLQTLTQKALDSFRGQHIGIIFQQPYLLPSLNCLDNLLLANYSAGQPTAPNKAKQLLATLHITHVAKKYPYQLSQGEAQRLNIARALMNQPLLVIADEPTSALDDENTATVMQLIQEQAQALKATLVIATHDSRVEKFVTQQMYL